MKSLKLREVTVVNHSTESKLQQLLLHMAAEVIFIAELKQKSKNKD